MNNTQTISVRTLEGTTQVEKQSNNCEDNIEMGLKMGRSRKLDSTGR
jgi:hypothetical protein